jgi:hypothetical protein
MSEFTGSATGAGFAGLMTTDPSQFPLGGMTLSPSSAGGGGGGGNNALLNGEGNDVGFANPLMFAAPPSQRSKEAGFGYRGS